MDSFTRTRPTLAALSVSRRSTKIKKSRFSQDSNSPVVVYLKSPKAIQVRPEKFMELVQRLTGRQASNNEILNESDVLGIRNGCGEDGQKVALGLVPKESKLSGFCLNVDPAAASMDGCGLTL